MAASAKTAGISDAAVKARTGKTWREWCQVLDQSGAHRMEHRAIAELVHARFGVPDWWAQMVTVGYEQARGLRVKHQSADGFKVGASRVVGAGVAAVFKAWADDKLRKQWLKDDRLVITTARPGKSVRGQWAGGRIDVNLYPKGAAKSQVQVQHSKLPDARKAAAMKSYWGKSLARMKQLLEAWPAPARH